MYVARDTSSTPEETTGTRCAEDMRCAVRVTVTVPCDSPDDSGVLVTCLIGQGEGAVTSAEKLEITSGSLVPPTADRKTGDHGVFTCFAVTRGEKTRLSDLPGARCGLQ